MDREKGESLRHQLDQEFSSLRSLLAPSGPTVSRQDAITLDTNNVDDSTFFPPADTQNDEYDHNVRELAFDKRAKAKDRTKTEEELALEEKETLERAERRRMRRMVGEDYDSEEEQYRKTRRKNAPDADDLDDFDEEGAWVGLGPGLTEATRGQVLENDSDESEEDVEEESEEDSDHSSQSSINGQESDTDDHDRTPSASIPKGQVREASDKELPFTFPCPSTHEELLDILGDIEDRDVPTVIQRIRALHHPSLSADNTMKLHVSRAIEAFFKRASDSLLYNLRR